MLNYLFKSLYLKTEGRILIGFKKIAKYAKAYFGSEPVIQEKDIFRFEVSFHPNRFSAKDTEQVTALVHQRPAGVAGVDRAREVDVLEPVDVPAWVQNLPRGDRAHQRGLEAARVADGEGLDAALDVARAALADRRARDRARA